MKQRYRLFRRSWGMFYWIDDTTGKQGSLKTKESAEARRGGTSTNCSGTSARPSQIWHI